MDDLCGIDASFTCDVPDYLKCIVCTLVLREPLQISKCGHKFCSACFEKLNTYPRDANSPLLCPVDRKVIDLSTVFEDMSTSMIIGSLPVRCSSDQCRWTGDLISLEDHEKKCDIKISCVLPDAKMADIASFMKIMTERMENCETAVHEKDKDLSHLKFNLQELRREFDEKMVENELLNNQNKTMEEELRVRREQSNIMKQSEMKLENLMLRNIIIEQKLESVESKLVGTNKVLEDDILAMKKEIKVMNDSFQEIPVLKNEIKNLSITCNQLKDDENEICVDYNKIVRLEIMIEELRVTCDSIPEFAAEVKELGTMCNKIPILEEEIQRNSDICIGAEYLKTEMQELYDLCKETKETSVRNKEFSICTRTNVQELEIGIQKHVGDICAIKKLIGETKACQQNNSNDLKKVKALKLNHEIEKLRTIHELLNEQKGRLFTMEDRLDQCVAERIVPLQESVTNLENITFCTYSPGCNDIVLMWRMQNYQYHCDLAECVKSPVFGIELDGGFLPQLQVNWQSDTGALGLFLKLHRAQSDMFSEVELNTFAVPYTFELQSKDGITTSQTMTSDKIDEYEFKFTIAADAHCMKTAFGFPQMVCKSDTHKYVINDTLLVKCILHF